MMSLTKVRVSLGVVLAVLASWQVAMAQNPPDFDAMAPLEFKGERLVVDWERKEVRLEWTAPQTGNLVTARIQNASISFQGKKGSPGILPKAGFVSFPERRPEFKQFEIRLVSGFKPHYSDHEVSRVFQQYGFPNTEPILVGERSEAEARDLLIKDHVDHPEKFMAYLTERGAAPEPLLRLVTLAYGVVDLTVQSQTITGFPAALAASVSVTKEEVTSQESKEPPSEKNDLENARLLYVLSDLGPNKGLSATFDRALLSAFILKPVSGQDWQMEEGEFSVVAELLPQSRRTITLDTAVNSPSALGLVPIDHSLRRVPTLDSLAVFGIDRRLSTLVLLKHPMGTADEAGPSHLVMHLPELGSQSPYHIKQNVALFYGDDGIWDGRHFTLYARSIHNPARWAALNRTLDHGDTRIIQVPLPGDIQTPKWISGLEFLEDYLKKELGERGGSPSAVRKFREIGRSNHERLFLQTQKGGYEPLAIVPMVGAELYRGVSDKARLAAIRDAVQGIQEGMNFDSNVRYLYFRVPDDLRFSPEMIAPMFQNAVDSLCMFGNQGVGLIVVVLDSFAPGYSPFLLQEVLRVVRKMTPDKTNINIRVLGLTLTTPKQLLALNTRNDVLSPRDKVGFDVVAREFHQDLDGYLTTEEKNAALHAALQKKGLRISSEKLDEVLTAIGQLSASNGEILETLSDPDALVVRLHRAMQRSAAESGNLDSISADTIALQFVKAHENQDTPRFSRENLEVAKSLRRRISAASPSHGPEPLLGLDKVLTFMETRLQGWMASGYLTSPFLTFTLMGKPGSGKTKLAEKVGAVLGAVTEHIVFSDYPFSHSNLGDSLLSSIQDAVEKLNTSANPLKLLILDEIHTRPDIINFLVRATESELRVGGENSLDLSGIILISILNVPVESEKLKRAVDEYKNLERLDRPTERLVQSTKALFIESFAGKEGENDRVYGPPRTDPKVLGAVASRLSVGMTVVPGLAGDQVAILGTVHEVVRDFEKAHASRNLTLILDPLAEAHLGELVGHQGDDNRSARMAVRTALDNAFGASGRMIHTYRGPVVIRVAQNKFGGVASSGRLEVASVSEDEVGARTYFEFQYRTVKDFLIKTIEMRQQQASGDKAAWGEFLNGFRGSAQHPVFSRDTRFNSMEVMLEGSHSLQLPRERSILIEGAIQTQFLSLVRAWYDQAQQLKGSGQDFEIEATLKMQESLQGLAIFFQRLIQHQDGGTAEVEAFKDWILKLVHYAEQVPKVEVARDFRGETQKKAQGIFEEYKQQLKGPLESAPIENDRRRLSIEFHVTEFKKIQTMAPEIQSSLEEFLDLLTQGRELEASEWIANSSSRGAESVVKARADSAKNTGHSKAVFSSSSVSRATGVYLEYLVRVILKEKIQTQVKNQKREATNVEKAEQASGRAATACEGAFTNPVLADALRLLHSKQMGGQISPQ